MKSIGKTYIIKLQEPKIEVLEGGIIIPKEDTMKVVMYFGTVYEYGVGWSIEEQNQLLPIGTKVILDWKIKEGKTKIRFDANWYMIVIPERILATYEGESF